MISILYHTSDYRGDHAADVCQVIDLMPGETVEALVARIMVSRGDYHNTRFDWIEIRRSDSGQGEG